MIPKLQIYYFSKFTNKKLTNTIQRIILRCSHVFWDWIKIWQSFEFGKKLCPFHYQLFAVCWTNFQHSRHLSRVCCVTTKICIETPLSSATHVGSVSTFPTVADKVSLLIVVLSKRMPNPLRSAARAFLYWSPNSATATIGLPELIN